MKFNVQRSPRRSEVKLGMKDVTEQVQKVDEFGKICLVSMVETVHWLRD